MQAVAATGTDFQAMADSWVRTLKAAGKSPLTVHAYRATLRGLHAYLLEQGMPTDIARITAEHLREFQTARLVNCKPATVGLDNVIVKLFFSWLVEEGEITQSPATRIKAPAVPETPPAVLREEQLRALVKACEGASFADRRDMALVRLLIDTGIRRAESAGIRLADLVLDQQQVIVTGKRSKVRVVAFGAKTAAAIDRYLRARAKHRYAASEKLFLGERGPLSYDGVATVVGRRAEQAGLGRVHAHQLRHSFAHGWLAAGGQEQDLMRLAGWSSTAMVQRYGASAAAERALSAHGRFGLGDKI